MERSLCVSRVILSLALAALIVMIPGCKTKPAPDAGFAKKPEKMARQRGIPFQAVWCDPQIKEELEGRSEFMVAPVNTSHLMEQSWWRGLNARGQEAMLEDIQEMAEFTRETFINEIEQGYQDYPPWRPVNIPDSNTLMLELAIVELVPNKRFWNTAMTAGGFLVPGLGLASSLGGGSVAIEGRVRDGGTKEILCEFKDRRTGKRALIDIQGKATLYGHVTDAIKGWARESNKLMHVPPGTSVSRTRQFRLMNW